MSHYRLYYLNAVHDRIEFAEDVEASDDSEALKAARMLITDRPIEVWSGARKVGRCEPPPAAAAVDQFRPETALINTQNSNGWNQEIMS
jgi:hypothetical protein